MDKSQTATQIVIKSLLTPQQLRIQNLWHQCGLIVDSNTFLLIVRLVELGCSAQDIISLLNDIVRYEKKGLIYWIRRNSTKTYSNSSKTIVENGFIENNISAMHLPNDANSNEEMENGADKTGHEQLNDNTLTEAISSLKEVSDTGEVNLTLVDGAIIVTPEIIPVISNVPLIDEPRQEKLTKFPIGRVKHIIKMDPDDPKITSEALFLVTKSVELFVESLAWEAHRHTEYARKKMVAKSDVELAIRETESLAFLDGALDN